MTINSTPVLPGTPAGEPDPELARWEALEHRAAQVMTSPAGTPVAQWAGRAVIAVLAGLTVHRYVPHPVVAVAAVAVLLAVRGSTVTAVLRLRDHFQQLAHSQPEPGWVAEMAAYRQWLPRRVPSLPVPVLADMDHYLGTLVSKGWRSAHIVIARYGDGLPGPAGRASPLGNRVEMILGSHIAEGPAQVAMAVLAHETRHPRALRAAVYDLGTALRQQEWIIAAAWALSWPAAVAAVIALRVLAMLVIWAVEVSCDLGAAADQGPAAMAALFDALAAGLKARRAAKPPVRRVTSSVADWVSGPSHPPMAVRRAIIRARHPGGGGRRA